MMTKQTETRKSIRAASRQIIRDCVTKPQAIRAGLHIAATTCISRQDADAIGCARAATGMADRLDSLYSDSATLAYVLARLVMRRDWGSLWMVARREAYPHVS